MGLALSMTIVAAATLRGIYGRVCNSHAVASASAAAEATFPNDLHMQLAASYEAENVQVIKAVHAMSGSVKQYKHLQTLLPLIQSLLHTSS